MAPHKYEPSITRHHVVRSQEPHGEAPAGPLVGCRPGDRCPRPHCGGLVVLRDVVTLDGACEELVCSSCGRSLPTRFREPYRALAPASRSDR